MHGYLFIHSEVLAFLEGGFAVSATLALVASVVATLISKSAYDLRNERDEARAAFINSENEHARNAWKLREMDHWFNRVRQDQLMLREPSADELDEFRDEIESWGTER